MDELDNDNKLKCEESRLAHEWLLNFLLKDYSASDMVPIFIEEKEENIRRNLLVFSCLIPFTKKDNILQYQQWDMSYGEGLPSSCKYGDNEEATYLRYGNDKSYEPIILCRKFHGFKPENLEIIEEFRLFHNLYFDSKENRYIKMDRDGNETVVIKEEEYDKLRIISIRLKELRQFLAIKEMCLSIQFDSREYSSAKLSELNITDNNEKKEIANYFIYLLYYENENHIQEMNSYSHITGKRLILPFPKDKSGMRGFDQTEENKYVDFIIGENEDGTHIEHSSNPETLSDNFCNNPNEPHYLTPVFFHNEVLEKYRNNPSKYSIESGILRCGTSWAMYIDNCSKDKISVWLGDLGRYLSYKEQLFWRSFNLYPSEKNISQEYYESQILGQFVNSSHPIDVFMYTYNKLQETSFHELGYYLLLPLTKDDIHCLSTLKLLVNNEQKEFDEQILALTKILIDSINEKELSAFLDGSKDKPNRGINLLEIIFNKNTVNAEDHIKTLRNLQDLRSSSTAHRKGKNYEKISRSIGLNEKSKSQVFEDLLQECIKYLNFLINNIKLFRHKKDK